MLASTIKIAFRNLIRQKNYSFVIIIGLAIGLSLSNVLFVFLHQELSTDSFHSNKERLFRLLSDNPMGKKGKISFILEKTSAHLVTNYPEIEAICKIAPIDEVVLSNERLKRKGLIILGADSSFFKLFDYSLLQGSKVRALQTGGMVITKQLAEVIFGHQNAVGEEILLQQNNIEKYVTITGVLDDIAGQSHLKFDALVSYSEFNNPSWGSVDYLLLNVGADPKHLETKINQDKKVPGLIGLGKSMFFLQPLKKVYFDQSNTRPYSVARDEMFIWVGWTVSSLILLIAGFNFINLFLLLLMRRKKEFGLKKVLGASVASIRNTAITEVFIYVSLSYALSLLFTLLLLPEFNTSLNTAIEISQFSNFNIIIAYGAIVILLSAAVVLHLTYKLSKLPPISVISGNISSRIKFNKVLLQLQFVVAIVLTICAITIVEQIDYIKNKPLGFNRKLIELEALDSGMNARLPILKQKLLEITGINHVTIANGNPLESWKVRYALEDNEHYTPNVFDGDQDLIKTFGLELIQGDYRNRKGKIVNEALVKYFNITEPLGKSVPGEKSEIIAVVMDFHTGSFKKEIAPAIISLGRENPLGGNNRIIMDYSAIQMAELLPEIEKRWRSVFSDHPFEYRLVENELLRAHTDEFYMLKIIVSFAVISIVITCFGLFSLAWAITQNRTKEIGIRKVIGATVVDIFRLLTYDFSKWILLAFILAAPAAYFLMHGWLQNFNFRIKLNPVIFLAGGAIIFLIALLTISIHTIKAARVQPVDELRNE